MSLSGNMRIMPAIVRCNICKTPGQVMLESKFLRRSSWAIALLLSQTSTNWVLAEEADWPTFRGSNRLAVSSETGLLQEWPKEGPLLVWQAKGAGRGYASLAIAGDRIITLGDGPSVADDKDEYLLAFDRRT